MRVKSLTSRSDGTISAVVLLADGSEAEVNFSTSRQGEIPVANPDQPIFGREDLDAAAVRTVISAVLAFDDVAAFSPTDKS